MSRFRKTGITRITPDLELKDFEWRAKSIHYDFDAKVAHVEVYMKERHYEHSRSFDLQFPGQKTSLSTGEILAFLKGLAQFENSEEL